MVKRELRKQQITARRQEQILNAALEIFAQKGYASATVTKIAQMAGVAAGTIYLYYPGKRELFIAVIENQIVDSLTRIFFIIQITSCILKAAWRTGFSYYRIMYYRVFYLFWEKSR
jgi:AcrR family transcriptional regulator